MYKKFYLPLILLLLAVAIGFIGKTYRVTTAIEPCSAEWFTSVEDRLGTGDSEGHGPDIGSLEWKSVVEFKLGIRNKPNTPDPASRRWCSYIDAIIHTDGS
ncbi:hypothetical protein [Amphritea sp. HPY]|uniref:hypothetical protein n=1 Tax=Amphritea sp. HPY TaxID=3421652 RepID=UPI003D7EBD5F